MGANFTDKKMQRWGKRLPILLTVTWSVLLCASQAAAQRQAIALVVLPDQEADAAVAQDIRRDILQTFTQDPAVQLIDPLQRNSIKNTTNPVIEASLAEGKTLLRNRQYGRAIQSLEQAQLDIHAEISKVSKSTLSDTMIHLAAAYLGAHQREKALQTLQALLVWRSQHNLLLPAAIHPPQGWRKLTDRARQWLTLAPTRSVQITSVPPGAEAFVNGRRLGPTPVQTSNLKVGTHYFTLKLDGYQRLVLPAKVSEKSSTISAALRLDPNTSLLFGRLGNVRSSIGSPQMRSLEGLDLELGASKIIFVIVSATRSTREIKAYLYHLRNHQLLAKTVLDTGKQLSADQLSALALWRLSDPTPARFVKVSAPRGETTPYYKTWWFWTLAGVGVAGVGLCVALPLTLGGGEGPDRESFYLQW